MSRSLPSSPERRLLPAFLLLAGAILLGVAPAVAQPPADVQAQAREVLKDPRFQRELPRHAVNEDLDAPETSSPSADLPADVPSPAVPLPALEAGAAVGQVVFIVLIVVMLVLLGVWISNLAVQRRRRATPRAAVEEEAAETNPREPTFDEASRLAAEGRYAEAVHALLLAAIRHFAERSRIAVQPSRTSRELVRLLPLGPDAREAFAELVRMVELSLFGGGAVGREDYERSLSRFQALTRRLA